MPRNVGPKEPPITSLSSARVRATERSRQCSSISACSHFRAASSIAPNFSARRGGRTGSLLPPGSSSQSKPRILPMRLGSTVASARRSEEHTSELQSLMRTSYAVFCLTNKHETKKQIYDQDTQK